MTLVDVVRVLPTVVPGFLARRGVLARTTAGMIPPHAAARVAAQTAEEWATDSTRVTSRSCAATTERRR